MEEIYTVVFMDAFHYHVRNEGRFVCSDKWYYIRIAGKYYGFVKGEFVTKK